jgi:16S rRNA (uracil1498-N3)-methyltransferase
VIISAGRHGLAVGVAWRMAERFFYPEPISTGTVRLEGEEFHHLTHVCRYHVGDRVVLFNGDGREYLAVIRNVTRRYAELVVESVQEVSRELPAPLWLAAPLPKGDRQQFLIEKLTELGTARYIPLSTQRSVITPATTRLEKLRRYVIEACKQCGRNRLMEIASPLELPTLLSSREVPEHRLMADVRGEPLRWEHFPVRQATVVVVGPEGGFTEQEIAQARQAGWQLVALGSRILRVETAAVFLACCFSWRQLAS